MRRRATCPSTSRVQLLSETQLVPEDQLADARGRARLTGSVGTALVEEGVASSDGIARMLALNHWVPYVDLASTGVDEEAARLIPLRVLERVEAIPYALVDDLLYVAIADPRNLYGIDELRLATGHRLDLSVASRDDILAAIGELARYARCRPDRAPRQPGNDRFGPVHYHRP
jgi:type IV pilus assembly protein PilB